MPGGKRTKLTPERQQKIVSALTKGSYFETACLYAGVSSTTGLEWLQRGRGEHPTRPKTPLYAEFAEACERAQAEDEVSTIARIHEAGHGGAVIARKTTEYADGRVVTEERFSQPDWTADAWRQERKHFQRWGRKERHEVTGKDGESLTIQLSWGDAGNQDHAEDAVDTVATPAPRPALRAAQSGPL